MKLQDKMAVVTGAGSGIGRTVAKALAGEGACVAALDINQAGLDETALGNDMITGVVVNVADIASVESAFEEVKRLLGGFDILVCAAGVVGSKFGDGPAAECSEEAWDHVMGVNLKGVWLCCKYALPSMLERGDGRIINISSSTALQPPMEHFHSHAYMTSKGGVITLTRAIASYYGRSKIRANVIAPGMIDTPMSQRMQGIPEIMDFLAHNQPLGQLGKPNDIAQTALFLASNDSSFITGQVIAVDGGWTNHG